MPSAKLRASKDPVIKPLLAGELENEIPDLDVYGAERKLLDFAFQDLETCLTGNLSDTKLADIEKVLSDEAREDEVKSFLKVWTKQWLEKWRERVTFCRKVPQFSLEHLKAKKKATKMFKQMERGKELKKMVVQRLISNGEVCMADMIAENLIIEEITSRLRMNKGQASEAKTMLDPWSIFQQVAPRIKTLAKRKMPIIHLKLLTDF